LPWSSSNLSGYTVSGDCIDTGAISATRSASKHRLWCCAIAAGTDRPADHLNPSLRMTSCGRLT
jgi:hypothetical protein